MNYIFEFKSDKPFLEVNDIMKLFNIGRDKAYGIIAAIRQGANGGKLGRGKVTIPELQAWYNKLK